MPWQNKSLTNMRFIAILLFLMCICTCAKAQDNTQKDGMKQDNSDKGYGYDYTVLTPEYLEANDPNYLFFRSFEEAFPELKNKYPLSESEKEIVGNWNPGYYDDEPSNFIYYDPIFFPNKLLIIFTGNSLDQYGYTQIQHFFGVWSTKGNIVEGILSGYALIKRRKNNGRIEWDYSFAKLKRQVGFKIYDLNDIHDEGYTLKPFDDIPITEEIQKITHVDQSYFRGRLSSRYIITQDLDGTINYGLFKFLPEMARKNISGEMIASDPEKYKKYLSFWSFWKNK